MTEEKNLYPLKFSPIAETFTWGGNRITTRFHKSFVANDANGDEKRLDPSLPVAESLELADLGYRDSVIKEGWLAGNTFSEIMDMYMDKIVGENVFDFFGRQFPLCVKLIDAHDCMPLRVHPGDTVAEERYDHLGKKKFWYILEAEPNARVMIGFRKNTDSGVFYEACSNGTAANLLNIITPRKGSVILIEPGTVHAAEGVLILEISQSSPLDFCLCSWGKSVSEEEFDSTLGIIEAMDFINYRKHIGTEGALPDSTSPNVTPLTQCREFTVNRIDLKNSVRIMSEESDSFIIYTCIDGEAELQDKDEDGKETRYILKNGETMLVPAEVNDFMLVPRKNGTVIIESFIEHLEEKDSYTGEIVKKDEQLWQTQ